MSADFRRGRPPVGAGTAALSTVGLRIITTATPTPYSDNSRQTPSARRDDRRMSGLTGAVLLSFAVVLGPFDPQARRPPPATGTVTTTVSVTVTDGTGAPLQNVAVRVSGPVDREAQTAVDGTVRLGGLRRGTYRFRFSHERSITLERDVTIAAAQRSVDMNVMLSAAERAALPPPPEPPKTAPAMPPPGKAMTVSLPTYIEQNFIGGRQPQKVSNIACSGVTEMNPSRTA